MLNKNDLNCALVIDNDSTQTSINGHLGERNNLKKDIGFKNKMNKTEKPNRNFCKKLLINLKIKLSHKLLLRFNNIAQPNMTNYPLSNEQTCPKFCLLCSYI